MVEVSAAVGPHEPIPLRVTELYGIGPCPSLRQWPLPQEARTQGDGGEFDDDADVAMGGESLGTDEMDFMDDSWLQSSSSHARGGCHALPASQRRALSEQRNMVCRRVL